MYTTYLAGNTSKKLSGIDVCRALWASWSSAGRVLKINFYMIAPSLQIVCDVSIFSDDAEIQAAFEAMADQLFETENPE